MKNDDYGFYGSGLDGYVHYRQGMAEAARNAPSSHSYNSYDSSDSDYDDDTDAMDSFSSAPAYSRPVSAAKPTAPVKPAAQAAPDKTEGAKLPPPVTPAPRPAVQQKEESSLAAVGKWLSNIWNAAWVISLLVASILGNIMDHSITQGALHAAYVVIPILLVTSVVELVRAIVFLSKF